MSSVRCPNPECGEEILVEPWAETPVVICPKCNGVFQKARREAVETPVPLVVGFQSRPNRWLTLIMAGLLGAGAAVVSAALLTRFWQGPSTVSTTEPFRAVERNFSFVIPGPPWQAMQDFRDRDFVVAINMRRADPSARFVLACDQRSRDSAVALLHADAIRFLHRIAGFEHLETEPRPDTELAGVAARRFVFQAVLDDDAVSGDVYIVLHQGTVYWLFRWCSAAKIGDVQSGLDDLRNRLNLLNERADWQPKEEQFRGKKLAFSLSSEGAIWQQSAFAADRYDPKADLVLESKPAGAARVTVLVLPLDGATPLDRARAHFLERQKDEFPEATISETKSAAPGLTYRVERQPGQGRWFWLAATEHAGSAVVIQCECVVDQHEAWQPEFVRLAATLKLPE